MKINLSCELCKIYVQIPLKQFAKQKDGGLFLHNLKCINCGEVYKTIDLMFDDYNDFINCSVCEYSVCEDCQPEHAVKHCFENNDAMKRPEEKKKVFRK